jgi:hypothetical protein
MDTPLKLGLKCGIFLRFVLGLFTLHLCLTSLSFSQIVLSEIMFNPIGDERLNEFIEIYNTSDSLFVDLNGWLVGDGEKLSSIVGREQGTLLKPGQFAILFVPSYYSESNAYEAIIPAAALRLTISQSLLGNSGLANSRGETVLLCTADSVTVSSWRYTVPNADGFSEEKRILDAGDSDDNWGHSFNPNGTPGGVNSVSPKCCDLAVGSSGLSIAPRFPAIGENITISLLVRNDGYDPTRDATISFYDDINRDNAGGPEEILPGSPVAMPELAPSDSTAVSLQVPPLPSGEHILIAEINFSADQMLSNNKAELVFSVGSSQSGLVINEIMYDPPTEQSEWVELYNSASAAIDIENWSLSDSDPARAVSLSNSALVIDPGQFVIISRDSVLAQEMPFEGAVLIVAASLPSLANEEDGVILMNGNDMVVDEIHYAADWGGANGRSLERINPQVSAQEKNNWSTCVESRGYTAGRENSVYTLVPPAAVSLSVFPDPFSPDDDGFDDRAGITYELPVTVATVNVKIYDVLGRLVRFLCNNEPSGSHRTIFWDGHNDEGRHCRIGIYIVYLEALDPRQGVILNAKKTVVLAGRL